jgi:hypothetical protein
MFFFVIFFKQRQSGKAGPKDQVHCTVEISVCEKEYCYQKICRFCLVIGLAKLRLLSRHTIGEDVVAEHEESQKLSEDVDLAMPRPALCTLHIVL